MMMKNKLIYWLIAVIILLGGIGGFFYFTQTNEPVNDNPNPEIVVEDLGGGERVFRNVDDGTQLLVDNQWEQKLYPEEGVSVAVRSMGLNQSDMDTELADAVDISLSIRENKDSLSINDWAYKYWALSDNEIDNLPHTNIAGIDVIIYQTEYRNEEDGPWAGLISGEVDYSLTLNTKYYDYECKYITIEEKIENYIKLCEKIIKNNILELI